MKKEFLLGAIAALALVGCSDSGNVKDIDETEFVLGFEGSFVDNATKAAYTTATFNAAGSTMAVFGWKKVSSDNILVFNDQTVTYQETAVNNSHWVYSPLKYWDKEAANYSFYAYAPSSVPATMTTAADTTTFAITDFTQSSTVSSQTDILLDLANNEKCTNYKDKVQFTFRHILSNINFQVALSESLANDATDNPVVITGFTLKDINMKGSYAATNSTWTVAGTASNASFVPTTADGTAASPAIATASLSKTQTNVAGMTDMLFIPQTVIDSYVLEVKYTIGKATTEHPENQQSFSKTIKLSDFMKSGTEESTKDKLTKWLPGYRYIYQLTIGPDPIIFDVEKVNNWKTETYTYTID